MDQDKKQKFTFKLAASSLLLSIGSFCLIGSITFSSVILLVLSVSFCVFAVVVPFIIYISETEETPPKQIEQPIKLPENKAETPKVEVIQEEFEEEIKEPIKDIDKELEE